MTGIVALVGIKSAVRTGAHPEFVAGVVGGSLLRGLLRIAARGQVDCRHEKRKMAPQDGCNGKIALLPCPLRVASPSMFPVVQLVVFVAVLRD